VLCIGTAGGTVHVLTPLGSDRDRICRSFQHRTGTSIEIVAGSGARRDHAPEPIRLIALAVQSPDGRQLRWKIDRGSCGADRAKSFTIDGEAVVVGPDGLSRFDELRRQEAARTAILYAFDLIEHDGEDLRGRPFLDRKAALARLLRDTEAGILFNEHVARMVRPCSSTLAGWAPRASCPRRWTGSIGPARARYGSRNRFGPSGLADDAGR
jgi:hypothetical protein